MKYILWIWFLVYAALYYMLIFYFMFKENKMKEYIRNRISPKYEFLVGLIYFIIFVICFAILCIIVKYTSDIYSFIYHWYYIIGLPIE